MEADKTNIIADYVEAHTDDVSFLLGELIAETENITRELLARGYGEKDIAKIWGGNLLRVCLSIVYHGR